MIGTDHEVVLGLGGVAAERSAASNGF